MTNDEVAQDVKDDLLAKPNFPGVRLKPRMPTRVGQPVDVSRGRALFKGADGNGVMVAIRFPRQAEWMALPGGEPQADLHLTLAYLGSADEMDPDKLQALHDNLSAVAGRTRPIVGRIQGYGRFTNGDEDVVWAGFDAPGLDELRHAVLLAVRDAALEPAGDHGWTPHVTLGYSEDESQMAGWLDEMERRQDVPAETVLVNFVSLVCGGNEAMMRLRGEPGTEDKWPQEVLPPQTFSALQSPMEEAFGSMEELEAWRAGRGPVLVRPVPGGVQCVLVKKGGAVRAAVQGLPERALVRLDDLVGAMRRIDHDYVIEGYLCARDLEGRWLAPDEIPAMLDASELAQPIFLACDLLVMDGDLTGRPARERLELLRALVPEGGGHAVVPPQVESMEDDDFGGAVDEALRWRPSDGEGLLVLGVTCVEAGSAYEHGETDAVAQAELPPLAKAFAFGAGPGAGTEHPDWRRRPKADQKPKPNFPAAKYSQDQPRDEEGQWAETGASGRPESTGRSRGLSGRSKEVVMWHGTTEDRAKKILAEGFRPGGESDWTLTTSRATAWGYARTRSGQRIGKGPVVLRVTIPRVQAERMLHRGTSGMSPYTSPWGGRERHDMHAARQRIPSKYVQHEPEVD